MGRLDPGFCRNDTVGACIPAAQQGQTGWMVEYGITLRAVTDEMLRIGTDLKNMYAILDKQDDCTDTE